jgi:MATE family multidrug resistance protein
LEAAAPAPSMSADDVSARSALRLAVPATISGILTQLYRPLDQYFVAGLGQDAQAAIGSMTFVLILFAASFLAVSAGAAPLVARATGARDPEERRRILGAGMFACGALALLFMVCGAVLVDPIVGTLGVDAGVAREARGYLQMLLLTGFSVVFAPLVMGVFASMGDTRLPLVLQIVNVALNAALNPILIYRAGLGTAGAALATSIAQTASVVVGVVILSRRTGLGWRHVRPGPAMSRIIAVGAPIAVATGLYAAVYMAMLRTSISPLGPAVTAGLGIGFGALEGITWPLYMGGSTALSSMIGRCLGAGRPDLAWEAVARLRLPVFALGVLSGGVFWFAGPWLVSLFAADDAVYREGVRYALCLAWSQPCVAFEAYAEGVLGGAGDSRKLFWTTVPFNVLRVPLAWFLAIQLGFGPAGVWWAINLTSLMKAVAKGIIVQQGGWSRLRI